MSRVVELLCSRRVPHVAVLALMSFGFAGCSADMSTRLSQNSFSNPFASQPEATGSVPAPAVERRELPQYSRPQSQYQSQALPPPIAAPQTYPAASGGVSGGGRGLASYAPPAHPHRDHRHGPAALGRGGPCARPGGTTIIVGTSDTLDILARRYHVSPAAILQANGYRGPRALVAGPATDHSASVGRRCRRARAGRAGDAGPLPRPARRRSVHFVNRGDTLLSIARHNHVPVAELARANDLDPQAKLKLGTKLTVPGAKTAAVAPAAQPAAVAAAQPAAALAPPATKMAAVTGGPPQSARLAQATTKVEEPSAESAGQGGRGHRRAADLPLAGARQGDHQLRRQDQRQVE